VTSTITRLSPTSFLELRERERRWCELLLTAMLIRAELCTVDGKSIADDLVLRSLERHARALRN
jgi:hypothetical protein